MKLVTILFLKKDNRILLAMKKRGFGAGKWNGVGGKVEAGESITAGAIRECTEEIGVVPHNPQLVGVLQFLEPADPEFHHNCHIFVAESWEDEPSESEEMRPQWFDITAIPYAEMWADDILWLPLLLEGKYFTGTVRFADDQVLDHHINVVATIQEQPDGLSKAE
jgi:8-oxo-dGTP diphosphatase / 2-hydroxy-dATP diphosphatase